MPCPAQDVARLRAVRRARAGRAAEIAARTREAGPAQELRERRRAAAHHAAGRTWLHAVPSRL